MQDTPQLPRLRFDALRKSLSTLILVLLIFSGGYYIGRNGFTLNPNASGKVVVSRDIPPSRQNVDFGLFWSVWDRLDSKYYDKSKIDSSKMVYGAIKGMVAALGDPYTVFLPPTENKVIQEDLQGKFEGVGIQIGFKGTQLAVIAPLPDSPAQEVGIRAGDYIIGIKDEAKGIDRGTVGISLPEAVEAIRGPAGSTVTLALLRDGSQDPLIVDVQRKTINVPSVILSYAGENEEIAHLQLLKFGGDTKGEWDKAVGEILRKDGLQGIALDVRNNPGGYLQSSVDIAGDFVKNGSVIVIEETANGGKKEYKTNQMPRLSNLPIVVLVNQGSASASEILAGALRDNLGIKIVGEKTFGKGTIQEPEQVGGGAGLHITIAKWLTPKGSWVNEVGLEPDEEIEDNLETDDDEQLQKAIELLR